MKRPTAESLPMEAGVWGSETALELASVLRISAVAHHNHAVEQADILEKHAAEVHSFRN
jgi:hypothetical protein